MNNSFFSIVIPTFNRADQLQTCLTALSSLNYPRSHFEVIVVDDGSRNSPESIINSFRHKLEIQLIVEKNSGPAAARNKGAEKAKGEFLIFLDDDCLPANDWLEKISNRLKICSDCLIGTEIVNALASNIYSTATQCIMSYLYQYFNFDPNNAKFFTAECLALSKALFWKVGGFASSFMTGEDREFCDRWLRQGYRMVYAPEITVSHTHALNLKSFWKSHFSYGQGSSKYRNAHCKRDKHSRIYFEQGSFYFNLMIYPFRHYKRMKGFSLFALIFLSQIANAAGFFWEQIRIAFLNPLPVGYSFKGEGRQCS